VIASADREVPPPRVPVERAVGGVPQTAARLVVTPGAAPAVAGRAGPRRLDGIAGEAPVRSSEPPPDQPAVAKQPVHLLRQRIGDDVEVLRVPAEQQITHAAADDERRVPGVLEPVQNLQSVAGDVCPADRVLGTRYDLRAGAGLSISGVQKASV